MNVRSFEGLQGQTGVCRGEDFAAAWEYMGMIIPWALSPRP